MGRFLQGVRNIGGGIYVWYFGTQLNAYICCKYYYLHWDVVHQDHGSMDSLCVSVCKRVSE